MFTGIVEELGIIKSMIFGKKSVILTIQADRVLEDTQVGDSIAVNGTCLTVTSMTNNSFCADVMPETVRRTSLAYLKAGSKVNLERALSLNTRLGGHIVSGHVDGLGKISRLERDDNAVVVTVDVERAIAKYIVEKGSVTIDGISLTVTAVTDSSFTVSLIPHTAQVTTFSERTVGDYVNIENDLIGKYVERLLTFDRADNNKTAVKSNITLDFLQNNGF